MSIRKFAALLPVCALFVACGGDATPEAKSPEGAAAEEAKPAEGEAAPAAGDAAPAGGEAAPADAAKPAEEPAK